MHLGFYNNLSAHAKFKVAAKDGLRSRILGLWKPTGIGRKLRVKGLGLSLGALVLGFMLITRICR